MSDSELELQIVRNVLRALTYDFFTEKGFSDSIDFAEILPKWPEKNTSAFSGQQTEQVSDIFHILADCIYTYRSDWGNFTRFIYANLPELWNKPANISQYWSVREHAESLLFDKWINPEPSISLPGLKLIGSNPRWLETLDYASRAAMCDFPVLITGETGSGKEIIAHMIHSFSHRASKQLIVINCASISQNLMESELFGYRGGSFTGADREGRRGWFELASGGTLVLDEVSELSLATQASLLRVLQSGEVQKIGGTIIHTDARILSLTNKPLERMVTDGTFRRDLYYRLAVFPVFVPPLRERLDDIPDFTDHFITKFRKDNPRLGATSVTNQAILKLKSHSWPGNIRELENTIARAMILCQQSEIQSEHIVFNRLEQNPEPVANTQNLVRRLTDQAVPISSSIDIESLAKFLTLHSAKLTSSQYAKYMQCSEATARRHLDMLCQAGILRGEGKKRGRRYILVDENKTDI